MDVNAVTQVSQGQPSAAAQESVSATSNLFAFLLKHAFGSSENGSTFLDAHSAIKLTATLPANTDAPAPAQSAPAPTGAGNANGDNGPNQSASPTGPANASDSAPPNQTAGTAGDNNANSAGSGGQNDNSGQENQRYATGTDAPAASNPTDPSAGTVKITRNAVRTGDDAATEATAAILAGGNVAPPPVTPAAAPNLDPVGGIAAKGAASAAPAAAQAAASGQANASAAAEDGAPEATPWSASFLSSVAAATPQIAQQSAGLSQAAGGGSASVSVQTSSGGSVAAPSAGALVPDAILAVSGFMENGQHGDGAGNGPGGQSNGQQSGDDSSTLPAADPNATLLAQDVQALLALNSAIQTMAQDVSANAGQTQAVVTAATDASASAGAGAGEAVLPQPAAPAPAANSANFAAQLQDTDETQAPQAPRQIALPSAVEQIKMQIEKGLAQGSSTIKVQLNPDNLGRVDVKLDLQGGSVKATITADRPETLQLLKNDQAGMLHALQDAGLNADSNSLSFSLRGDHQRQFAQSNQQGNQQPSGQGEDVDPLLDGISAISGASSRAGAGNLDISV